MPKSRKEIDSEYHRTVLKVPDCFGITKGTIATQMAKTGRELFKCGFEYVRPGDELLHVFSHHIHKTEDELREILRQQMIQHLDWLKKVSKVVLREVNVSLEDYIDTITTPGVPLDFVALLVLCRVYHFHVTVYTARGVWTTERKSENVNFLFSLVYNGNFNFTETVQAGRGQEYRQWLEQHQKKGKLPSHDRSAVPGTVKIETKLSSLPDALTIVNNNVICNHPNAVAEADEKESAETKKHVCRIKKEFGVLDFHQLISEKSSCVEQKEASETVQDSPENIHSDESLQDSCIVLKCDETLPYSEEESKIGILWQNVADTVAQAQSAVGLDLEDSAENAEFEFEKDRELLLECPMCLKKETTQKACIKHITSFHPEYRFKCSFCEKDFAVFHTKYRHEKEHEDPKFMCGDCGAGFQYSSELQRHMGNHNEVLPYHCDECDKCFAMKKSLKRHENVHNKKEFPCTACDKIATTLERLYSHFRGMHGKGYNSKCGKNFQWPGGHARHQEGCDPCKEILAKEAATKRKVKDTVPKPAKQRKVKTESDDIPDLKKKVQCKIENILAIKKDM